jgi:glutamyl-Q tRNA(Asp) synthetase
VVVHQTGQSNAKFEPIKVIGRFAPSPSGGLHMGSLVAALGSYLSAKSVGGQWLIRMDDIDKDREPVGAAERILHQLEAFHLHADQPICWQSQRLGRYREVLNQLIARELAFPCFCSRSDLAGKPHQGRCLSKDSGRRGQPSWRLLARAESVRAYDRRLGSLSVDMALDVGDVVLWRADDWPSYQLANVVDDADFGVTEVVRGEDLWDSTPRQIYLQQLMGWNTPNYLHLPLVLGADGQKLSKQNLALEVGGAHAFAELKRAHLHLKQLSVIGKTIDEWLALAARDFDASRLASENSTE